jgi:geranylgeranyl diphosphate synthase type II
LGDYRAVDGEVKNSAFLDFIASHRCAIENDIFRFMPRSADIGSMRFGLDEHWKMVVDYPERGGKYVRPGLVLLSTVASGGDVAEAMTTAAAMEVSEDWILVHDDFQDHSEQRRGKPSAPVLFGDELSVNAGDHLHLLMWQMLLSNRQKLGEERCFRVADEMSRFLQTTCEGQYLELTWARSGRLVEEEEYFAMVERKTCWYTIIGPLRLGALVVGNDEALEPLVGFGMALGKAFQIHDDWLNVFSTETGKELGGDLLEGKRTLLLARLVQCLEDAGDDENLSYLRKAFALPRGEKSQEMVERVISLYEKHGCREWTRERGLAFAAEAKERLGEIPYSNEGKALLEDAVDFIINREL